MADHTQFTRDFKELTHNETQAEVARKLDYAPPRISQIATGQKPSREFMERLIRVYDLPREAWLAKAGFGSKPDAEDERETIASRAVELAFERMGLSPEVQAVADELKHTKEQLGEAERILAEIVEVQQLHQARNPGAPPLDVDFFRDPDLPFAEKIRRFTVLRERIARGELD